MTPSAVTYNKSPSGDSRFIGAGSWRSCRVAWSVLALVVLLSPTQASTAISLTIKPAVVQQEPSFVPDSELFSGIRWRNIGPDRGGRSIAVAGHRERPLEYFFGATGGGLWKTSDGGITWRPMTDAQIGSSSVGSVAIAESDADIVWMGTGEGQLRGNVMQGDGIYKSGDAGITWSHMGLRESRVIARIRIHPSDPDTVYAAVLGDPYQDTPERGIYKTADGGSTWDRVLFKSEKAGAIDLAMDPNDPQTLYATMWQVYRRPYRLWSGGSDSAVYKTTDGGLTWFELTRNPGLPSAGPLGKMGITVSPVDSDRVYLLIEHEEGGLYRSDDGGANWVHVTGNREIWQRPFYFMRLVADPVDRDALVVLSAALWRSVDGGANYQRIPAAHSDQHDIWISPDNPNRMIVGNDGGPTVTTNGGQSWSPQNVPTAQIYRVATTADFPYHVTGAQQDNSTIAVPSWELAPRTGFLVGSVPAMYAVGGGENSDIAPHPSNPDIFFSSLQYVVTKFDRRTDQTVNVAPYPRMEMGSPAREHHERWNWLAPLTFSPVPPHALYVGSQHLWRSRDFGESWEKISPDLTYADPETLQETGGPIRTDQDGPEVYGTVFSIEPSSFDVDTVWVGSDDGLVHVTRNGGATWSNVTPPDMPKHTRVSAIEASPHEPATAYVAGKRYEMADRRPYLWKTNDYGATWTRIQNGIAAGHFTHVVREDPVRRGLLFCGTEHGVYISFDDGAAWQPLQLNLPDVHVPDLEIREDDVVIATHGRSFWVLDNISPLRQLTPAIASSDVHVFDPADEVLNVDPVHIDYYLAEPARQVTVEIVDGGGGRARRLVDDHPVTGMNRITWDGFYEPPTIWDGIVLEGGMPQGPFAPPGEYEARVNVDGRLFTRSFKSLMDPRHHEYTVADLQAQFELALRIRDQTTIANEIVLMIRDLEAQMTGIEERLRQDDFEPEVAGRIGAAADGLITDLVVVNDAIYQPLMVVSRDRLAFPIRLNNRLSGLLNKLQLGNMRPNDSYYKVFDELVAELAELQTQIDVIFENRILPFNDLLKSLSLPPLRYQLPYSRR